MSRSIDRVAALVGHFAIAGIGMSAALPSAHAADEAADFPNRPIRVVIGFSAGGVVDVSMRIIVQKLGERWKQQVIADNRPGAGGIIAAQIVANANPDGYTLLSISAAHVIAPALYAKIPYDTLKDFAGVTMTVLVPNVLVVSPARTECWPGAATARIRMKSARTGSSVNARSCRAAPARHSWAWKRSWLQRRRAETIRAGQAVAGNVIFLVTGLT